MADARDILGVEKPAKSEVTKESLMGGGSKTREKKPNPTRTPGLNRELAALLGDSVAVAQTPASAGYKERKADLGIKKVRHWKLTSFTPPRSDRAVFHYYRRGGDLPPAFSTKKLDIISYTPADYKKHLRTNEKRWNMQRTDHLFDLAQRFGLNFIIMADRWDRETYGPIKDVEDLKERYYEVVGILSKARGIDDNPFVFDAAHERRRKAQLQKLWDRTPEQVAEEIYLKAEIKKFGPSQMAALQKAIAEAEGGVDVKDNVQPKSVKKLPKRKEDTRSRAAENAKDAAKDAATDDVKPSVPQTESNSVSLRSLSLLFPASLGNRKIKALEAQLKDLAYHVNPTPFEDVALKYNKLIAELLRKQKLESALKSNRMELENLKKKLNELPKKR